MQATKSPTSEGVRGSGGGGGARVTAVEKKDLGTQRRDVREVGGGGGAQAVDTTPTLGALEVKTPGLAGPPDGALETTVQSSGVKH